jgi:hypothetical protein
MIMPLLILLSVLTSSSACEEKGFLPHNDLAIPIQGKGTGLTEVQYNSSIDKVESVYLDIVAQYGGTLKIERKWDSPIVNAGTFREENGKNWHINLYGGLARHEEMTEDGFALVVCHEIGHHLGGAPKKSGTYSWSSTEGQADYFATLKCLRKIFAQEDNLLSLKRKKIPRPILQLCQKSMRRDKEDTALCIRTSLAGMAVAKMNASVAKKPYPFIDSPDANIIPVTYEMHPEPQCRLDTYFQGSLCWISMYADVSQTDESKGTCYSNEIYPTGTRPLCWFAKKKAR